MPVLEERMELDAEGFHEGFHSAIVETLCIVDRVVYPVHIIAMRLSLKHAFSGTLTKHCAVKVIHPCKYRNANAEMNLEKI